ncbi:Methyltransferase domain protein [Streptomyces sp. YIM 130001]|nr:Methyltransferase domain protein [Streptomyces sp. YIM 130001]
MRSRARDWAEIQERMPVPLYEAVYERLEVGPGTRLLGLGCGSGLALLLAARRGADVTGVDSGAPELLALAGERLESAVDAEADEGGRSADAPRLVEGGPADAAPPGGSPYNLVTAFSPIGAVDGDFDALLGQLAEALPLVGRGGTVVLAGWGPPERCAATSVLRLATRLADPLRGNGSWRSARRDDLEEAAARAGLVPDGSGRVACPFGYADVRSAVRGLMSTGLFDAATRNSEREQVAKELAEALHPYVRRDGTVWMPHVFRYLIARTR